MADNSNYEADVCSFIADIEGNLAYFVEYCKISKVVELVPHPDGVVVPMDGDREKRRMEFKNKSGNTKLCFGGDSQDKGIGDIRVVLLLLDLRARYPNRVHFIIGNRDCNKLRLAAELSDEAINDEEVAKDKGFPYWVPADKRVTPEEGLAKDGKTTPDNPAADRLKWMLKHTMGSDGAFERRKWELEEMNGKEVSDDEVVQSYRDEVDPMAEGNKDFMLQYLKKGCLGFVYGSTLFVHGGVNDETFGLVPGHTGAPFTNVKEWILALNKWKDSEVAAFENDPRGGKNSTTRKGHGLMDYGVPCGACDPPFDPAGKPRTVICCSHLKGGNASPLSGTMADKLTSDQCANLIVGHIPHGDCPTVIRSGKAIVLMADTSYSAMGHKTTQNINGRDQTWVDNRGGAVSEVLVWHDGRIEVHGRRREADGSTENAIQYSLRYGGGDPYVGRRVQREGELKDYWVKARYADGSYCLCLGQGFKLSYATRTREQLDAMPREDWDLFTLPADSPDFIGDPLGAAGTTVEDLHRGSGEALQGVTKRLEEVFAFIRDSIAAALAGPNGAVPSGTEGEKAELKADERVPM